METNVTCGTSSCSFLDLDLERWARGGVMSPLTVLVGFCRGYPVGDAVLGIHVPVVCAGMCVLAVQLYVKWKTGPQQVQNQCLHLDLHALLDDRIGNIKPSWVRHERTVRICSFKAQDDYSARSTQTAPLQRYVALSKYDSASCGPIYGLK